MRILFIQHQSFINSSGGTEKICCFLASHFAEKGHQVAIATNENATGSAVFQLHDNVEVINIYDDTVEQVALKTINSYRGRNIALWTKEKIKKKFAKYYNKGVENKYGGKTGLYRYNLQQRSKHWGKFLQTFAPDLIITMSISSLLEITFQNQVTVPIINSTNGRPDYDYTDLLWFRNPIEMQLLKESYAKLAGIQVLFKSYLDFMPETFRGISAVIPNPVPKFEMSANQSAERVGRKKLIHVGSLIVSCKQQDIAIKAFRNLASDFPDWDFHLWGTGPDEELLKNLVQELNLQNRVFLNGFTKEVAKELSNADIFIFPSSYEGFPLALTEAMAVGLPSVGLRSCSGVNELILHDENGLLAEGNTDLENKIRLLMSDENLQRRLGNKAKEYMKKYSEENYLNRWDALIEKIINS